VNPTRKYITNEEQLRSVDISIYNRYIHTQVNIECETLREAIRKGEHQENECWINAITDNYQNLFQHKKIARENLLEILGKTEDNIKDGVTIQEVMPFFEKIRNSI
jgi:hypothetical protein